VQPSREVYSVAHHPTAVTSNDASITSRRPQPSDMPVSLVRGAPRQNRTGDPILRRGSPAVVANCPTIRLSHRPGCPQMRVKASRNSILPWSSVGTGPKLGFGGWCADLAAVAVAPCGDLDRYRLGRAVGVWAPFTRRWACAPADSPSVPYREVSAAGPVGDRASWRPPLVVKSWRSPTPGSLVSRNSIACSPVRDRSGDAWGCRTC
jgi:hypothetical protein